jgi:Uma2 family endonuclease
MANAPAQRPKATAADLAALPADLRAEVIGGEIVEKASPSAEHGDAQLGLGAFVRDRFHGGGGGGRPGGWWIMTEVEIELERHEVYRPDLLGWRRERVPGRPTGRAVRERPDWICEILSPSNADRDLVGKMRVYYRHRVPHYWIVDPVARTLIVYRWTDGGYLAVLTAGRGEIVRAEPFEAVELPLDVVFGEELPRSG